MMFSAFSWASLLLLLVFPYAAAEGTCDNSITGFKTVNPETNSIHGDLVPSGGYPAAIFLEQLGTHEFNIQVDTLSCPPPHDPIESVLIQFAAEERCENKEPYTLFGDIVDSDGNVNYNGQYHTFGTFTLKATPFTGHNCQGDPGVPMEIEVTLFPCAREPFRVWNADKNVLRLPYLRTYKPQKICQPDSKISFEKHAFSNCVGEMEMKLTRLADGVTTTKMEYNYPYFLYGNRGYDYIRGRRIENGYYELTTTADGDPATRETLEFEVVDCSNPRLQFTLSWTDPFNLILDVCAPLTSGTGCTQEWVPYQEPGTAIWVGAGGPDVGPDETGVFKQSVVFLDHPPVGEYSVFACCFSDGDGQPITWTLEVFIDGLLDTTVAGVTDHITSDPQFIYTLT